MSQVDVLVQGGEGHRPTASNRDSASMSPPTSGNDQSDEVSSDVIEPDEEIQVPDSDTVDRMTAKILKAQQEWRRTEIKIETQPESPRRFAATTQMAVWLVVILLVVIALVIVRPRTEAIPTYVAQGGITVSSSSESGSTRIVRNSRRAMIVDLSPRRSGPPCCSGQCFRSVAEPMATHRRDVATRPRNRRRYSGLRARCPAVDPGGVARRFGQRRF